MDPLPFHPTRKESIARARAEMAIGMPVALRDGETTTLVLAAERTTPERLSALIEGGDAILVLTRWRAETLRIPVYDDDLVRLPLGPRTEPDWLRAMIDPARDLDRPLKGPFTPLRGTDARLHRLALGLVKSARLLPAVIVRPVAAVPEGIVPLDVAELRDDDPASLARVVAARVPLAAALETRLHVFRPDDGGEDHYAVVIGQPDRRRPVLARVHSACLTGDVFGSLKCDCGAQLDAALHRMAAAEGGVLLYLNQEGRGIGLSNKMRAYALQDQGYDTVEANHRLGFDDDERDFRIGAAILRDLNVTRVRLLTNNPRKVAILQASGIEVTERVPLWVGQGPHNAGYLRVKAEKSGHIE